MVSIAFSSTFRSALKLVGSMLGQWPDVVLTSTIAKLGARPAAGV
jgi:hypothetical protein